MYLDAQLSKRECQYIDIRRPGNICNEGKLVMYVSKMTHALISLDILSVAKQ